MIQKVKVCFERSLYDMAMNICIYTVLMCISPLMARELMSQSRQCLMLYQVPSQCSSTCWCSSSTPRLLFLVMSFILWRIVFTSVWIAKEIYWLLMIRLCWFSVTCVIAWLVATWFLSTVQYRWIVRVGYSTVVKVTCI